MPGGRRGLWGAVLLLLITCTGCLGGIVRTESSVTAVLGLDVSLSCYYETQQHDKVTQVIWSKKAVSGQNVQLAILNTEFGAHVTPEYEGRVKEKSPLNPVDATIILKNVVQADEGIYQCRVSSFPAGTFEADVALKVLVPPLPSLNPGPPLVEGVGLSLAASCTAEGNPAPSLTWETEVLGKNSTKTYSHARSASVTSEFYVVPTRRMHRKPLTCVVSHPVFLQEKRLVHTLEVEYLSDVSILGSDHWFVGMNDAALICQTDGFPELQFSWFRVNASLPKEIRIEGNQLKFTGPLRAEDAGTYICEATNGATKRQATATATITVSEPRNVDLMSVSLVSVAVVTALLVLILVIIVILVNRHHKRKTKKLSEKIEELSTLSRQTSRRRLNSNTASTDTRMQLEESMHLRGHHPDSLRDPSISSMMGEEADRRSYSTLTTVREIETQTELLATVPDEEVKEEEDAMLEEPLEDKELDQSEHGSTGVLSTQPFIKQGMSHFYQENGTLRAKPTTNGIYINGRGHLV